MTFADAYGPVAVVTGVAQGIGAAFVSELSARGVSSIGVDRSPGCSVVADLAAGVEPVLAACEGVDIGLLICNAAATYEGPFLGQGLDSALTQLDVNCRATLELVHALLPRLVARGRGGVLLMSSLSAMRGAPIVAGYAATKAWNLIFAESLWGELHGTGVDVMAVLPGSTRTPGWLSSNPQESLGTSNVMEPADVARESLDALGSGPSFIPGAQNRESEAFMASLDRREAVRIMGDVMRQMYPG